MRVFRRALGDSRSLIASDWKRCVFWFFLLPVGFLLGFLFLEEEEVKSEAVILILFTIAPFGAAAIVVFLWNLWLAPYKIIHDKLDRIEKFGSQPGEATLGLNTTPANPSIWKHAQELKLFQIAELSGGLSPHGPSEGSNDIARAVYSELFAALEAGTLKGSSIPGFPTLYTRVKRKDLQKYFSGRDDCPEFLKE